MSKNLSRGPEPYGSDTRKPLGKGEKSLRGQEAVNPQTPSGQSEPLIHVLDFPPSKMMCGAPVVIGEPCVRWRHAEHATCEECKREAASR